MADNGHLGFTKSVLLYGNRQKIFNINFFMLIDLNAKMLITTNLSDSFDYQSSGPTMNFLGDFTHARDQCFAPS